MSEKIITKEIKKDDLVKKGLTIPSKDQQPQPQPQPNQNPQPQPIKK